MVLAKAWSMKPCVLGVWRMVLSQKGIERTQTAGRWDWVMARVRESVRVLAVSAVLIENGRSEPCIRRRNSSFFVVHSLVSKKCAGIVSCPGSRSSASRRCKLNEKQYLEVPCVIAHVYRWICSDPVIRCWSRAIL